MKKISIINFLASAVAFLLTVGSIVAQSSEYYLFQVSQGVVTIVIFWGAIMVASWIVACWTNPKWKYVKTAN